MAEQQGDPVGIDHWYGEILRLTNAAGYQRLMTQRRREWADQAERRGITVAGRNGRG